jgi:hypothetical protein
MTKAYSIVLSILLLAWLSLICPSARADEPPYLDFARALREKRRAPDLALEYLQGLSKKPNLPKDLIAFLPLEMAECRMELAQLETDPEARNRILAQAEKEFREFLAGHPNSPQAAGANLHLARIVSKQGMSQLTFALRQDSREARIAEKEKARAKFDQAAGSLTAAGTQIDALLKKQDLTAAERRSLSRDKRLAQFELGVNLFHKADTFTDGAARSETIGQAREVLKKLVASGTEKDSLHYEYVAWLARCYAETDDPKNAEAQFGEVLRQKGPESEPGKRLASYFRLQFLERDPNIKPDDRPKKIESEAANWLSAYKEYDSSPEGYAVRFLLGKSYFSQAQRLPNQKSTDAQNLYAKAENLFDVVEHADNDFSQEAHELRMQAIFQRSSEISGGEIAKLEKFQECYLRAQYEIHQMGEEGEQARKSPSKQKESEAQRQKRLHNTIEALSRALELVDDQTTPKDQTEAQYLLTFAYLASDLPYQAAVLGEDLARRDHKSPRAVTAAGYALEGYSRILAEQEQKGAPKTNLDSDRNRVRNLASFMEATWPKNPATNQARYQLGLLAIKTNNYAEAVVSLSRVTPDYPAYPATQFDLAVFAALPAMRDKASAPPGQPQTYYQDQAIAALRRIPEPAGNPDPASARYYLLGKQRLAMLLLGARQYDEMVQVSQKLQKQFKELTIEENLRKGLEPAMETLGLLTQYAQAEVAYRSGQYDKVRTVIDPMLKDVTNQVKAIKDLEAKTQKEQDDFDAQLQQKIKSNQPLRDEDQKKLEEYKDKVSRLAQQGHWKAQLLRSLLVLALRSKVQEGNTQQAQEVFEVLKNTSEYLEGGATGVLLEIVQQLKAQISELEAAAAKDPAKKEELNKILAGFTTFLDKLAEQPATLSEDLIGFVSNSYSGMKKHKKAAEMLAKIPPPSATPANPNEKPEDKEKREQEDRRKEAFYHHVRLTYVRELRLDKQFDKASAEIKKIVAGWGRNNLDAQKEQIYILQDEEKYAQAANMWGRLMQDKLKPHVGKDNRLTEQYFECYYYRVWCTYKFGAKQTDPEKKQKYLAQAASQIFQLDRTKVVLPEHLKRKFDDLLKQEPPLQKQYDQLKKGEKAVLH